MTHENPNRLTPHLNHNVGGDRGCDTTMGVGGIGLGKIGDGDGDGHINIENDCRILQQQNGVGGGQVQSCESGGALSKGNATVLNIIAVRGGIVDAIGGTISGDGNRNDAFRFDNPSLEHLSSPKPPPPTHIHAITLICYCTPCTFKSF
jgi:hypothetical protein